MAHPILRPAFTRVLAQQLEKGACIRLFGPEAFGRSRLLDDLEAILDHDTGVVRIDLSLYAQDYAALMQGLGAAIGAPEPPEDFGEWVEALKLHGGKWLLVLDHFELLEADARDPQYDQAFFAVLQWFAFSPALSLLAVSDRPAAAHISDIDRFVKSQDLDLEEMALPPLSLRRLKEEFSRLAPLQPDGEAFAVAAFGHPLPLDFLAFLATKSNAAAPAARKGLEKSIPAWRLEFDHAHGLQSPPPPPGKGWLARLGRRLLALFFRDSQGRTPA